MVVQEIGHASLVQDSLAHTANVVLHVTLGMAALLLGFRQLIADKGDDRHRRYGRRFLAVIWGTVATAALGILVFQFRAFLGVITLLVAYWAFAGTRALRIRLTGLAPIDAIGSLTALAAAGTFVWYLRSVHFPWSPVVIYSTLGSLVAVATYDLARFTFPRGWVTRLAPYEHVVKMIGAYSATLSAFAGTVLGAWQPYSQLLPSVLCSIVTLGYLLRLPRYLSASRSSNLMFK